jgi:hypothetical protein
MHSALYTTSIRVTGCTFHPQRTEHNKVIYIIFKTRRILQNVRIRYRRSVCQCPLSYVVCRHIENVYESDLKDWHGPWGFGGIALTQFHQNSFTSS